MQEEVEKEVWSQCELTHPDCPLVHSADAPLRVDAQRTLGLLGRDGTHGGRLVRTRHMAGEVTHCSKGGSERVKISDYRWRKAEAALLLQTHLHRCSPGG